MVTHTLELIIFFISVRLVVAGKIEEQKISNRHLLYLPQMYLHPKKLLKYWLEMAHENKLNLKCHVVGWRKWDNDLLHFSLNSYLSEFFATYIFDESIKNWVNVWAAGDPPNIIIINICMRLSDIVVRQITTHYIW